MKHDGLVTFIKFILILFVIQCIFLSFSFYSHSIGDYKKVKSSNEEVKNVQDVSAKYLNQFPFEISSCDTDTFTYILTKDKLLKETYMKQWAVSRADADKYLNKRIYTKSFALKYHPLNQIVFDKKVQVHVTVLVSEGKVIGSYTYLTKKNGERYGDFYTIEGLNIELYTQMSYEKYKKEWVDKYK